MQFFTILVVVCGLFVEHNQAKHQFCKIGDWPFMVKLESLASGSKWICGGVIWNNSTVLTSAGCLMNENKELLQPKDILMYLVHGYPDTSKFDPTYEIKASEVILHPGVNRSKNGDNFKNYIGLIRLETSIEFSGKHKEVIPVPFGRKAQLNSCKAIGWGGEGCCDPNHYHEQFNYDHMKQITLNRHPSESDCHQATALYVPGMHICISGSEHYDSILPNDYGGPLMCPDGDGQNWLVGIALREAYGNWVNNISLARFSYFLNVSHYRDWIEENAFKDFTDSTAKSVNGMPKNTSVDYQSTDRTTPRSKGFVFWIIIIALIVVVLSIAGTLTYLWLFKKSIPQGGKGTSSSLKKKTKSFGSAKKSGKSKTSQRSKRMSKSLTGKDKSSVGSTKSPTSNIIKSALSMSKPSSKSTQ